MAHALLGSLLLRKLRAAVVARDDHVNDFHLFTDSLPAVSVLEWTPLVEKWEENNNEVNPFVATTKSKWASSLSDTSTNIIVRGHTT